MASKQDINPATGKPYAVNPSTGVWDDNYWSNTVEPQLKQAAGSSGGNFGDIAANALKMYQEAAKPAISSLEASIPEISQKYTGERTRLAATQPNLEARYDNLLNQIRGNQVKEESRTQIATSNELGRRGISAQGGLFDKTINEALNPITEYYTGQINTAGLSREDAIRQLQDTIAALVSQETEATRGVRNSIGQLQSATSGEAINSALSMYSLQQQSQENALNRQLQEEQLGQTSTQNSLQNALAQAQLAEQQRQFNLQFNKPGAAKDPTKLTTQTVTDVFGNTKVVGIDPFTGKTTVLYDTTPASSAQTSGGGYSLSDIYNAAASTVGGWWNSVFGQ